jgi:hypothetical protein
MRKRLAIPVVLVLAGVAVAGDKELKAARTAFEGAVATGDEGALERAAARLARQDAPRGLLELVAVGLGNADRRAALAARAEIGRQGDPRCTHALAARLLEVREPRARRLLAEALGTVPGDDVGRALGHALDDRDASVRAAAARSLASRSAGTAALASGVLREHALRDPNLRVRQAAAGALVRLGLPPLRGFDVTPLACGLPSRFFSSRVLFLLDASDDARESAYAQPRDASQPAPRVVPAEPAPVGSRQPRLPALPTHPVSAFDVAGNAVASAVLRLADDQTFDVIAFSERSSFFAGHYVKATARATGDARDWLKNEVGGREARDVVHALRGVLEGQPLPDEVWIFLTGPPSGRGVEPAEAVRALADAAWENAIPLHVVILDREPAAAARDERERLERARAAKDRRDFAQAITEPTGGQLIVVPLPRLRETAPETAPVASHAPPPPLVPVVNGRVAYADLAPLRKKLDAGLKDPDEKLETLARELAAAPDEGALELALRALRDGPLGTQLAVLDGLARNRSPHAVDLLVRELRAQSDPAKQVALAHGLGVLPGPAAAKALAVEAERREGSGDVVRVLHTALAHRPADELAPIASEVGFAARHPRTGLALFEARRAIAMAHGALLPVEYELADDRLLPERFVATGVTFLVDSERAMDEPFSYPPRPPKAKVDPSPISRREVVEKEVDRALEALAASKGAGNVLLLGENAKAWRPHVQPLAKTVVEAKSFVADLPHTSSRAVLGPLERALEDPDLEEIWVVAAGLPERSDRDRDAASVQEQVATLAWRRDVRVNVVLAPGEVKGADLALALATRKDWLEELSRFWKPLAARTGGVFAIREQVRAPEPVATPARGGASAPVSTRVPASVAPVQSPTAPAPAR